MVEMKQDELRITFRLRQPYTSMLKRLTREMGRQSPGEIITTSKVLRAGLAALMATVGPQMPQDESK